MSTDGLALQAGRLKVDGSGPAWSRPDRPVTICEPPGVCHNGYGEGCDGVQAHYCRECGLLMCACSDCDTPLDVDLLDVEITR